MKLLTFVLIGLLILSIATAVYYYIPRQDVFVPKDYEPPTISHKQAVQYAQEEAELYKKTG